MTDIIKNDCQGEEPDGKESIPVFLARISKALYGNVESLDADDVCRLAELADRFFTLDCQAASHVESVICMRSAHFTGEPPYTGWKGLGKALREDYDDFDRLHSELGEAREIIGEFIGPGEFYGENHGAEGTTPFHINWNTIRRARSFLNKTPEMRELSIKMLGRR